MRPASPPSAMLLSLTQGSAFYLLGSLLVIIGWTFIGLLVEAYGFWLLFCEFLPAVVQYARRMPFISKALDVPWLKQVCIAERGSGGSGPRMLIRIGGTPGWLTRQHGLAA